MRWCLAGMVAVALSGPVAGQGLGVIERSRGQEMLDGLRSVLERRYYDSTYGGRDLDSMYWRARRSIDTATAWPTILSGLAQFLQGLGDSHTRFIPPDLAVQVNYGWSWRMVGEDCYVTEVRRNSDAERRGLRPGDKVVSIDGLRADRTGMHLIWYVYHALSPRAGMRLSLQRADGTFSSMSIEAEVRRVQGTYDRTNLEHARIFWDRSDRANNVRHDWRTRDSVAIWRFDWFKYDDRNIDQYMTRARSYPWLIVDLRGNPGGAIATLTRLIGYFFEEEFSAYTIRWRDSSEAHMVRPQRPTYQGQVIILVDSESGSSAEIFSRVLQQRGRAMVIGDRTAGAVMTSISVWLEARASNQAIPYGMSVTIFDVIMTDGLRLEGVGVTPHVAALPTAADIAEGRDPTMQFALELAGIRVSSADAGRIWR